MVLYHAVSTYQLLEFIIHKVVREIDNEAAIIISNDIIRRYPNYQIMLAPYFKKILVYDNSKSVNIMSKADEFDDYFNLIFTDAGISINEFEQIYSSCCHAGFGIYISRNMVPYIFFEDAAGALSHAQGVQEHVQKGSMYRDSELTKYGLYDGTTELCKKRIYNMMANKGILTLDKDENFDVALELSQMDVQQRKNIIGIFTDNTQIPISKNNVLFLTEHLYNLGFMTWNEQCLMYQLVADYFLQDYNIIFKTHPDDLLTYKKLFPNSKVIREKIPSELLPYLFENIPDCVATISSTSILGMKAVIRKKLEFNQTFSYFEHQFYDLHKYYFALKYIEYYLKQDYELILCGVNSKIIDNFAEFVNMSINSYLQCESERNLTSFASEKQHIYIIDKTSESSGVVCSWLKNLSLNDVVIFINSDNKFCFYHPEYKELWNYISPVKIKKECIRNSNVYDKLNDEIFYVFRKGNSELIMKKEKKELKNAGIIMQAEEYTEDKLRIMVLEGLLEATEKRLQYYMKKCEEEQ